MTDQPISNEGLEGIPPIRTEDVKIPEGEIELAGTMFYPREMREKNPATLFVHGWKSAKEKVFDVARDLAEAGEVGLAFDMRGHGASKIDPNTFSRKEFLDDVIAAYDFLANNPAIDKEKITVLANSFGAYIAVLLTTQRKVEKLCLRVPAIYPDKGFDEPRSMEDMKETKSWRSKKINWNKSASLAALHEFRGNVLIVQSGKDETVTPDTVQSYVDAVKNKEKVVHILMADAEHSIRTEDEHNKKLFRDIVKNWIISKAENV